MKLNNLLINQPKHTTFSPRQKKSPLESKLKIIIRNRETDEIKIPISWGL
jgi:hypothetical protein